MQPSLVSAVILGVAMAEVGVSIQHDANHGAFSASGTIGSIFGATLDVVGASSFMWRQQHMVGHHVHTNVHGRDPDIRVSDSDVRRVTQYQPRHWYQVSPLPRPPAWCTTLGFGSLNASASCLCWCVEGSVATHIFDLFTFTACILVATRPRYRG